MLSRRYRPVAVVVVATLLLLILFRNFNGGMRMPGGWLHGAPPATDADTTIVQPDNGGDSMGSNIGDSSGGAEAEKLLADADTVPAPEEPTPPHDDSTPTEPDDGLPTDLADATPIDPVESSSSGPPKPPSRPDDATTPPKSEDSASKEDSVDTKPSADDDGTSSTDDTDWSRFAYTQYVTNSEYLCNSVMIFETLHRLGSKADRVMMYPAYMFKNPTDTSSETSSGRLLIKSRDEYGAKLVPIQVQHRDTNPDDTTWDDSYTKLLAFNQTQYDRVLALDSDSVVLQPMDELFLIPSCPVAMPRAYWLLRDDPPRRILSSQIMLLEPDTTEFERIMDKTNVAADNEYDMEIVNQLYLDSAFILPHRKYDLLTAEFRSETHELYLGSDREKWDPAAVIKEAKFVHFSDWPVPKPWLGMEDDMREDMQPKCSDGSKDCPEQTIWNGLYNDFLKQRQSVCGRSPPGEAKERRRRDTSAR